MVYPRLLPLLLLLYISNAPKGAFAQTTKTMDLLERADELFYAKRYRKALRVLDQLLKKEPNNYKAYFLQNFIYRDLNKPKKREEAYQKTLAANPLYAEGYYYYGGFLSGNKRFTEAHDLYKRGIQKLPNDAKMYEELGFVLKRMNNYPAALAAYNKAIALNPRSSGAYYQRGSTYTRFKMYKKALTDYTQSIHLDPDSFIYGIRASLRFDLGDYDGAMADYQAAARLDTTDKPQFDLKAYRARAFTSSNFAYSEWRDKDLAKAQKYGKEALKWADDPDEKAYLIEQMKQDAQKLKEAPLFAQAQSLHQQGLIQMKEKKYQAAMELFKKGLNLIKNTTYVMDPLSEKLINLQEKCLDAMLKKDYLSLFSRQSTVDRPMLT